MIPFRPLPWGVAALACALTACTTLSDDAGTAPVTTAARERLGQELRLARTDEDAAAIAQRVNELLATPLGADSATQIALLNNRGLQASLHELGIAEAEMVQASRLPNPRFSFARLTRGSEVEIDRTFSFNLGALLALPFAREVETHRFNATQQSVTMEMLALAAQARQAWVSAVAAEQSLHYAEQVKRAANASAELAARMARAGNFSRLQQMREQGFQADAALGLARAQQARVAARERLTRLLGLSGAQTQFTLPERLPDLPQQLAEAPDVAHVAAAQRLDVQAARAQVDATARNLGLGRATRFVSVLEFGYQHNTSNEQPRQTGYEISFEIPLFDWSGARVARAEAVYQQSAQRAAQAAINAQSELREAYEGYRSAWEIARQYRDEIVPTARRISEENLLRYNGMLIGVFELLADARAQIGAVNAAIEAQRDFWVAQAALDMALVGPTPR
ncbi:TolC family protein [Sphaerotilaceae bacterium SBD11-9]